MEKLSQNIPSLEKSKLSKRSQKEEDEINKRLTDANQMWNDWKFQIYWNKIEWVNPKSRDERKIHFVCLQKN